MYRSKKYLDYVRAHDCSACGKRAPSDAHHVAARGISPAIHGGGMGQKMDDMWVVPVCRRCHMHWHSSITYRCFPGMNVDKSDELVAKTLLTLMSRWIMMLDPESGLF